MSSHVWIRGPNTFLPQIPNHTITRTHAGKQLTGSQENLLRLKSYCSNKFHNHLLPQPVPVKRERTVIESRSSPQRKPHARSNASSESKRTFKNVYQADGLYGCQVKRFGEESKCRSSEHFISRNQLHVHQSSLSMSRKRDFLESVDSKKAQEPKSRERYSRPNEVENARDSEWNSLLKKRQHLKRIRGRRGIDLKTRFSTISSLEPEHWQSVGTFSYSVVSDNLKYRVAKPAFENPQRQHLIIMETSSHPPLSEKLQRSEISTEKVKVSKTSRRPEDHERVSPERVRVNLVRSLSHDSQCDASSNSDPGDSESSEYSFYSTSEDESSDSGIGSGSGSVTTTTRKNVSSSQDAKISKKYSLAEDDCPYQKFQLPEFSEIEVKTAKEIKDWIKLITDPTSTIVKDLQSKYQNFLPGCKVGPPVEPNVDKVLGDRDSQGRLHGEVENFYVNGDYFWGDYEHGSKEGMASVVLKNGDSLMGRFKNNQLDGYVQETIGFCDRDNVTREVFYHNGIRHGFYREFGPGKEFWAIGRFINGEKKGGHWKGTTGNGYLVGQLDSQNRPTGDDILFLYPDNCTVLQGTYDSSGKLVRGELVKLTGMERDFGMPVPTVARTESNKVYKYEPSTSAIITKNPMLRDVYEQRYVFVKASQLACAGEGLFAKQKIPSGQLCALFNGIRQRHLWGTKGDSNLGWSDYRISMDRDIDLDIRKEQESLKNYRATLGHKTCHSFSPNASFAKFWHPRFGTIMSLVAKTDILPGEEILVSYNYDVQRAPEWYQELWFHHLRLELGWTEKEIHTWAQRIFRKSGIPCPVRPPPRDSHRFVSCGRCHEHVGLDSSSVSCETCESWYHLDCSDIHLETALEQGNSYKWFCEACK